LSVALLRVRSNALFAERRCRIKFERKSQKWKSQRSERALAKRLAGTQTPASGALSIKGDVQTDDFVVELKETNGVEFRLRLADLVKVSREAFGVGKTPCLIVQWNAGAQGVSKRWILRPLE